MERISLDGLSMIYAKLNLILNKSGKQFVKSFQFLRLE